MTDFDKMTDLEFEMLLENELPEMPPEEIMKEINPISKSMSRITWGIATTFVTINMWGLNYILQALGAVMLYLGFRTLRQENKAMRTAYIIAAVTMVYQLFTTIMAATIYLPYMEKMPIFRLFGYMDVALMVVLEYCLWTGIKDIQQRAGTEVGAPSAFMLLVWTSVMIPLAMVNYKGRFELMLFIIIFFIILRCIFKLSKTLDEAGYSVEAAPVKIEDGKLVKLIISVVAVGMVIGMLFFQKVPMNWEIMEREVAAEVETVKEKLIGLGYPEYALNDLTNQDILDCKDAIEVTVNIKDLHPGEDVIIVGKQNNNPYEYTATDVVVKMGDGKSTWKIFHHFKWNEDMLFCGTEGVEIWPAWRLADDTVQTGELSGRVLYDKKGKTYESEYNSLEVLMHESSMAFMNFPPTEDIFAEFSFPHSGENQRGYVSYSVVQTVEEEKWDHITSTIEYLHQKNPIRFNAVSAKQALVDGAYGSDYIFDYIQSAGWRSGRDRIDENRPPEKLPPHPDEGISH